MCVQAIYGIVAFSFTVAECNNTKRTRSTRDVRAVKRVGVECFQPMSGCISFKVFADLDPCLCAAWCAADAAECGNSV